MSMKKTMAALVASFAVVAGASAAIVPPDLKDGAAPVIDGTLNDPAWQNALVMELGEPVMPLRPAIPGSKTSMRILAGGGKLYLGFECLFAPGACVKGAKREHDAPVFEDESLELFIAPDGGANATNYYHFALNTCGATTERKILDPAWDADWQSAVSAGPDRWTAEMVIPLAALGGGNAAGHYWQINACRNMYDASGSFAQGLALARPGYHSPNILLMSGAVSAPVLLAAVKATLAEMEGMKEYLAGPDKKQYKQLTSCREKLEAAPGAAIPADEAVTILEAAWKNAGKIENSIILNYMFE